MTFDKVYLELPDLSPFLFRFSTKVQTPLIIKNLKINTKLTKFKYFPALYLRRSFNEVSSINKFSLFFTFHNTTYTKMGDKDEDNDYYKILEIEDITVTKEQIQKQFKKLVLKHHPDKNRDDPKAGNNLTYNIL